MKCKDLLVPWIIIPLLTSCATTGNFRTISLEFLRPGYIATDSINTIAIFNRDYNYNERDTFYYQVAGKKKLAVDTLVSYKELSNTCTDALADSLLKSGYFNAVFNFRDSLNNPAYAKAISQRLKAQKWTGFDAYFFLDFFELKDCLMPDRIYFDSGVLFEFPEFESSTVMETVNTILIWTIVYKNDTLKHTYRCPDNLHYGNSVNHGLFGGEENHRKLLTNTARVLGESFAAALIPYWQKANRIYFRSHNPQMMVAQKYLLSENYKESAAIYRQLTDNKNKNIAAKATYNMALICEIEGNLVAAIDWLAHSSSIFIRSRLTHFNRCSDYIYVLKIRQKEIESLNRQLQDKTAYANEQ